MRYHLADIPDDKRLEGWSLEVGGDAAERPVTLRSADLNALPQSEVVAVCQCSGNRRGLVQPHVPGVQWGNGAMGCATWHGPRLRDVLARAGIKPEAVEIWLAGLDQPVIPSTPAFRKSLPLSKALADETIVATAMNGGPLPRLNGFPVRLIVPGWTSTYWMKHLSGISISAKPLDNFWMAKAYRVPAGMFPVADPFESQNNAANWPITEIVVNSLIASPVAGEQVERSGFTVRGVAWDRGNGIQRVEVSLDAGASWQTALLDRELGRYAFRTFSLDSGPLPRGSAEIRVRAISNSRRIAAGCLADQSRGIPQRKCPATGRCDRGVMIMRIYHLLLIACVLSSATKAQSVVLPGGVGKGMQRRRAGATCHSLAYIPMNLAISDAKAVAGREVAKMRTAFGAPIDDEGRQCNRCLSDGELQRPGKMTGRLREIPDGRINKARRAGNLRRRCADGCHKIPTGLGLPAFRRSTEERLTFARVAGRVLLRGQHRELLRLTTYQYEGLRKLADAKAAWMS